MSVSKSNVESLEQIHNLPQNQTLEERVGKLEELAKVKSLRTCHEYSQCGLRKNGKYNIDPDGDLVGHEPFEVFCDFGAGWIICSRKKSRDRDC